MINVKTLHALLNFKDDEVKHLTTEQLRLLLGVLRYSTRTIQRQLNERETLFKGGKS